MKIENSADEVKLLSQSQKLTGLILPSTFERLCDKFFDDKK